MRVIIVVVYFLMYQSSGWAYLHIGLFKFCFLSCSDNVFVALVYVKQLAAVAALCVQYEADFRPNMSIVVKALQPLLNARSGPPQASVK